MAQAMVRGEWTDNDSAICFFGQEGEPGCTNYNGQQRLAALVRADQIKPGITIMVTLKWGMDPDSLDNMDIGRTRSLADTLDFIEGPREQPGHRDVASTGLLALHISQGTWASRLPAPTRHQQVMFIKENNDLYDAVALAQPMQRVLHGPVAGYGAAVWLMSHGQHVSTIDQFIEAASFVENSKRSDPHYLLNRRMNDAYAQRSSDRPDRRRGWWYTAVIIKAWNAYVSGKRAPKLDFTRQEDFPTCL
jgi:hypothetical protein